LRLVVVVVEEEGELEIGLHLNLQELNQGEEVKEELLLLLLQLNTAVGEFAIKAA
jgi:hypothetical protein